ncbi:glycosyltransferase family 4 protein [Kaistella sp. G5-32]|uniref:Glycosyltransferase family 4 protein n=1 Tax=Kaistella gelatinilytica TaxID=2787636 RepID=A0ABS0FEY8_9FLAO|nr:glycosyltransferase family 1 protein [Kaistella gelatinilytica]MBF8458270.1 glycosyltransferase family 4 protein [Kaistella gelatinilytica]
MKIKLIFDIEVIANSYKHNETGIFRVAYEMFKQFFRSKEVELLYSNFNFNDHRSTESKIEKFFSDHSVETRFVNQCKRVKFIPFRKEKLFRLWYEKNGIRNYKITYNKEIISEANIYHSFYYPIHRSLDDYPHVKKVVTVHDLIPILFPQYNDNTELLKETVKSIGKYNYAICVSENTRQDLLKYAPDLDPKKIFVALLAASPEIFYPCKDPIKFIEVKEKYNLPDQYFLSLSTLEPRKNIDFLIRSFIKMITTHKISDMKLVLVGSKGWDYNKIFEEHEKAEQLKDRIIITGRIPDEDLASIYSGANSFYYMSLYEGFGLPPLEAMQCGVATVTSNTSSLPEVVGDAGIILDPTDENSLSETMWNFYSDENLRKTYAQKAIERAKEFSWEKTMQQHLNIYNQILKN